MALVAIKKPEVKKPKLRRVSSDSDLSLSSSSDSDREAIEKPKEKPKLRRVSSDSDLSLSSSSDSDSDREGGKKVYTDLVEGSAFTLESKKFSNLFEVSPSDGQETKNFNPVLFEGSGGQETKDFNSKLLESSFDGEESKKFSTNLFEVSPSDGQETKDFKCMDCCRKGMQSFFVGDFELFIARAKNSDISRMLDGSSSTKKDSMWDDDDDSSVDEDSMWDDDDDSSVDEVSTDGSWVSRVDVMQARNELILADSKWIDDDDSSVDEELLKDYLERLDAKHLTKKEVEWKVDDGLSEVKADAYHSLTSLQRMNWITSQFILERYDPPCRSRRVGTPPPPGAPKRHWIFCHTDSEDSDLEDLDQEDCISD